MTLTLLWEECRASNDGQRTWGFTQFCEHYKRYTRMLRRSMRQLHRAGEKLFSLDLHFGRSSRRRVWSTSLLFDLI